MGFAINSVGCRYSAGFVGWRIHIGTTCMKGPALQYVRRVALPPLTHRDDATTHPSPGENFEAGFLEGGEGRNERRAIRLYANIPSRSFLGQHFSPHYVHVPPFCYGEARLGNFLRAARCTPSAGGGWYHTRLRIHRLHLPRILIVFVHTSIYLLLLFSY